MSRIAPEIAFRNVEPTEELSTGLRAEIERLDAFYDEIMSCRVVVEIPHPRRRSGNIYSVRIDVTVPGSELVVSRETPEYGRHEDLWATITNSFGEMVRQLEDYVRRKRGQVKAHQPQPHGRVSRLFEDEGYGFLETADGYEIYFHRNSVVDGSFDRLAVGDQVAFALEEGAEGPQASTVRPMGKHGLAPPTTLYDTLPD